MPNALAHVVTIPAGADLLPALAEALGANVATTWLQGTGHIEAVELRIASEGADPTRSLRGRFTLVALMGPATGPVSVTLARATDAGLELFGGHLVRARSAGITIAALAASTSPSAPTLPSQPPRRELAAAASPPSRPAPAPEVAASARPASAPETAAPARPAAAPTAHPVADAWAAVAASSEVAAEAEAVEEIDDEEEPITGDIVDHFSFGPCEVVGTTGDRLRIRDLKGAGRIREISIDALVTARAGHLNGKRLFRLMRKP